MNVQYCHNCSVRIDPEEADLEGSKFCPKCAIEFGEDKRPKNRDLSTRRLKPVTPTRLQSIKYKSSRSKILPVVRAEQAKPPRPSRRKLHVYIGLIALTLGVCGALLLLGQVQKSPLNQSASHETTRVSSR